MPAKIKRTRPELKRRRDMLQRFERYLPTLKLKQQQLQVTLRDMARARREAAAKLQEARETFEPYRAVLADRAGVDVGDLAACQEVKTSTTNIAGVTVPQFEDVVFATPEYSLFATPPWVDRALADLRDINRRQAELDVLQRQVELIQAELTTISQRVNLFEKVMIPETREAIRVIRIHLGDQMTAAVGTAKIAKNKLAETKGLPGGAGRDAVKGRTEEAAP